MISMDRWGFLLRPLPMLLGYSVLLANLHGEVVLSARFCIQVGQFGELPGLVMLLDVFCSQVRPLAEPHLYSGGSQFLWKGSSTGWIPQLVRAAGHALLLFLFEWGFGLCFLT